MNACPVCAAPEAALEIQSRDFYKYNCPVCGGFTLFGVLTRHEGPLTKPGSIESAVLSHSIRRMQRRNAVGSVVWPTIADQEYEQILRNARLPSPAEQADNLITWLGETLKEAGDVGEVIFDHLRAIVGSVTEGGAAFIVRALLDKGMIDCQGQNSETLRKVRGTRLTLTLDGWQDTRRSSAEPRTVARLLWL
jgi:hypothetical protein